MTRHQAHRVRFDARYIGLALMLVSAGVTAYVGWVILSWFLSLLPYIQSAAK